ncbi:CpaF family protein [Aquihabitans sp. McL0605]|uniref:CpaF family protein n=1 Tax=Aquihabitans sp. McL0605 TaxID=3415671 RepID=UPI003CF12984
MTDLEVQIHRRLAQDAHGDVPDAAGIAALVRAGDPLRPVAEVSRSVSTIQAHLDGLGLLEPLLRDRLVTDVMVNGPGPVWVERAGQVVQTGVVLDRAQIDLLVERIVAPLGRRADPVHALVDARLADGSRVHVVVPPLAVDGPCITIRRFSVQPVPLVLIASEPVAALLRWAVDARCNIVVSGSTGSGKTTLLNALAGYVPVGERIITVEDAAELRLAAPHVVRLESRPASPDGAAPVTIRDLVRNALRMRPDRLIVGEVRGPEALELLSAMNTGHDGSMSTVHANGAADAVHRLETLVLMAGVGLPDAAVRTQLLAAIDLVVHLERDGEGGRHVAEVVELAAGAMGEPGAIRRIAQHDRVLGRPTTAGRRPGVVPFAPEAAA